MTFIATTTISVLDRTIEKSALDDDVYATDNAIEGLTAIPFAITWRSRRVFFQESQTWRTVRVATGRGNPARDIQTGDRILDERTGIVYVVDQRNAPGRGLAGVLDATFDLRLLSAP